jgi:pyruvate dehydrogenase E1 component alpha subunit
MSEQPDLTRLYRHMVEMRAFEEALAGLWRQGLVSGEMHLGIGEEAIVAGVLDHLIDGDALSLDYRPTPALARRGVSRQAMVLEVLGHADGLGGGKGGHMHLLSREHLAVSTGIVGSPAPLACGFSLAAKRLRPGSIAVGFFGDGAVNQGMVMEAWNLAVAWELPVLFVCKDNQWAATTRTAALTGGTIGGRARSFGLVVREVDGTNVLPVWKAARPLVAAAREGTPGLLLARCRRPSGHMLDDTLSRAVRNPRRLVEITREALGSDPSVSAMTRLSGVTRTIVRALGDQWLPHRDPLRRVARQLGEAAPGIEQTARARVARDVQAALQKVRSTE